MRFNKSELISLATNPNTKFDKEGLLGLTERQEGLFWRTDVNQPRWCKLRGNLLFYHKDSQPKSPIAGMLVLENCRPIIYNVELQPEPEGYAFILEFEGSVAQRIYANSSAERLEWVNSIKLASNAYLNQQIKRVEQQIAAIACETNAMGNRIEPGLLQTHEAQLLNEAPLPPTQRQQHQTPFQEDLSELPICEAALSCDNLARNALGRAPNVRVVCTVMQPGEDWLWREHARTEVATRAQSPHFLCTMCFRRSAGFTPETMLRFTVYDVRERFSSTELPLGHVQMRLSVLLGAPRFRVPLNGTHGTITLESWAPDAVASQAPVPPRSSTQLFDTQGSEKRRGGHRRTQSLPQCLGLHLFVPAQCQLQRVCTNARLHTYRLLGADISVQESMLESRLCYAVPQQLLGIWIQREKELLQEISGMGELRGNWRWRQFSLLEEHLLRLRDYSQAKQNIQQLVREGGGVSFKRSACKTDEALEFLPVNLHLQRMWAQNEALQYSGLLDIITVGAFTRYDDKGSGGLIKMVQECKGWKLDQTNACNVQIADDTVQTIKQLRREIVELMTQLLQLAKRRCAKGMMPLSDALFSKSCTLLSIWEPIIVEEAVQFFEQHRVIDEPQNVLMEPMSPFHEITQQLHAWDLKSPEELEDFATPNAPPTAPDPLHCAQKQAPSHPLMRSNSWHAHSSLTPSADIDIDAINELQHAVQCYGEHLRTKDQSVEEPHPSQTPQPQSLPVICQGVVESEPVKVVLAEQPSNTTGFLDQQKMSRSSSANFYRPNEEPEPLELTKVNIEASVLCLISKINFFCGRSDIPMKRMHTPSIIMKREGFPTAPAAPRNMEKPLESLKLDLTPPRPKSNKSADGLELLLKTDWAAEMRPPMRKLRHAMDRLLKTARLMHSVQRLQQNMHCTSQQAMTTYRRDVCFSQALTALVTALMVKLWATELNAAYFRLLRELGPLAYFEGLLTLNGKEADMWSDMCIAIEDLSAVNFTLERAQQQSDTAMPTPRIVGSRNALEVLLPVPEHVYSSGLLLSSQPPLTFKITPVFFNIGINANAIIAESFGMTGDQHNSNCDNFERLRQYCGRYSKLGLQPTHSQKAGPAAAAAAQASLHSLLDDMEQQLHANVSRNVKILHLAEDVCRKMLGLRFTSCKSAKDRTGMAVTLEQCRVLVREFQLPAKQVPHVLHATRSEGTRMDNVIKNIGDAKYAFFKPQVSSLPKMYRPPVGTYGKANT